MVVSTPKVFHTPLIRHDVHVWEEPSGAAHVVSAVGTIFPSLELYQYDASGNARMLYFDAVRRSPGGAGLLIESDLNVNDEPNFLFP